MKNKKLVMIVAIILAILCVGVGYAAVNDTLTVNGQADVVANSNAFDQQIYFESASVVVENAKDSASVTADNDIAQFVCGSLTEKDDQASFTFVVKNAGDLSPNVTAVLSALNGGNGYFEVTQDWGASRTIAAGSTETLTVTVKLLQTPAADQSATFNITLTATAS